MEPKAELHKAYINLMQARIVRQELKQPMTQHDCSEFRRNV